jgi:hypothetical protein
LTKHLCYFTKYLDFADFDHNNQYFCNIQSLAIMKRKYPVGLQDFDKIRSQDFVYVDKTPFVHNISSQGGYYFLSRPRRFGKSLLLSTFYYLYLGRKELFEGLYIEDKWDWNRRNPIIKISFASISHKEKGLYRAISDQLDETIADYGLEIESDSISAKFQKLIKALHAQQGKVVVLIDEYDKPIIDYLGTPDVNIALENRDILKSFYSILKDADPHLELVFITGVSKFSRVSIFSDLNNLTDLTLDKPFDAICGISQQELETNFIEELQETDNEQIKRWYNGYSFGGANTIYNPFSLLHFFRSRELKGYWFSSGTPTFLINLSRKYELYDFEEVKINAYALDVYDIERLQLIPLMFQTGYLTIKSQENEGIIIYTLGYPNLEVKYAYLDMLMTSYTDNDMLTGSIWADDLKKALSLGQVEKLQSLFDSLFKSIPYELWQKQNEHYYHAIIHLTFRLLGIYIESQVHSSDGRLDALVQTKDYVYCFEFKLNGKAEVALQQIKDKGYLMPYLHANKTCIGIGLNFSKKLKKVEKIVWEKF